MEIPSKYKDKYFYHFTHIENLDSIVKNGLLSTNEKNKRDIKHVDVANEDIQNRRSDMDVTCSPYGKVHDYVPFYWATTNPMLLSLTNNKNIDQPFIVFFAVSIDKIFEDEVIFTDASANTSVPPNFYSSPDELDLLDWKAIDKTKWGCSSPTERHRRMAEVLVYNEVPLDWISNIIVWNESFKEETIRIFNDCNKKPPVVNFSPFKGRHFYYTKFLMGRNNETLVTGPYFLKNRFEETYERIITNRETNKLNNPCFKNVNDAIEKLEDDFCLIPELEGIFELETDNQIHNDNVSDHTCKVVANLSKEKHYESLAKEDKQLVQISAYLHDIGKGPKSRWEDEIQTAYPDHPADGLRMLIRILSEDFEHLTNYQVRKICLLVGYHDLIGDILERGRSKKELIDLKIDNNELTMLIALSLADVSAINMFWKLTIGSKISNFVSEITGALA